jgi:SP family sugar:H+ symporter-like MFS transporter
VVRGTSVFNDRRAYLIPYCLFYVVPVIVASLIWTIPESPRWLMTKNRMDEARVNHKLYREGTMSDEAIEKEFQQLHEALLNEPEQGRTSELFKGYDLKRTLIVVTMNAFQQATGQAFISQYGEQTIPNPLLSNEA